MALDKVTYVNGQTVIGAENLNDIQDAVIQLENDAGEMSGDITALETLTTTQGNSISALQNTTTTQGNAISTLQSTTTTQGNAISTLQSTTTTQGNSISTLQNTATTQGNKITALGAMVAPVEASSTAASAHAVGDYFRLNDVLYIATAAIAVGNTITPGTNCRVAVVGDEVSDLKSAINDKASIHDLEFSYAPDFTWQAGYVNQQGVYTPSTNKQLAWSGYIEIPAELENITLTISGHNSLINQVTFYTQDKTVVETHRWRQDNNRYLHIVVDSIPSTAVYVAFCNFDPDITDYSQHAEKCSVVFSNGGVVGSVEDIKTTLIDIDYNYRYKNVYTDWTVYPSKTIYNGVEQSNANCYCGAFQAVKPSTMYTFFIGEPPVLSKVFWIKYFDEYYNYLSEESFNGSINPPYTIETPETCAFIRLVFSLASGMTQETATFAGLTITEGEEVQPVNSMPFPKTELTGKKWVLFGDSITDSADKAQNRYFKYICAETGIVIEENLAYGGSGYCNLRNTGHCVAQRAVDMPTDASIITIFAGINDCLFHDNSTGQYAEIGEITDTTTLEILDTTTPVSLMACVNLAIDTILAQYPANCPIGIISPLPCSYTTDMYNDGNNVQRPDDLTCRASLFTTKLKELCDYRGIPFLDLFHTSNWRPWITECRNTYTTIYSNVGNGDGLHPNSNGHKLIYRRIKQFVESICS